MPPRIALIAPEPPAPCGVVDYSMQLKIALEAQGLKVDSIGTEKWNASSVLLLLRAVRRVQPDIVHIQYPSVMHRNGLAPQALACLQRLVPTVVTLHEFSHVHFLRRVASVAFFVCSDRLIFTTRDEERIAKGWAPWISPKTVIIRIGSSIPSDPEAALNAARKTAVIFFGTIRPKKGLEQFLQCAELDMRRGSRYNFTIIGTTNSRWMSFCELLYRRSSRLRNVVWHLNRSSEDVAELLRAGSFAYLYYPDGASERRSSLLAALANGLVVISNSGKFTSSELLKAILTASTPLEALNLIDRYASEVEILYRMRRGAIDFAADFSWEVIARQHAALYESLLSTSSRGRIVEN